jgi:uncharacterized protein (TIGR02001 family)
MKKPVAALAAFAFFAIAGPPAHADGLSANVSLTTKYKYRGQDQSDPDKDSVPAIQGGFDYTLGGFYVGNWNSSIGWLSNGQDIEMDFYGGYRGEAGVLGYDVGLLQYYYPGSSSANTTEIYGGISYGIATAKLSYVASDKYFGATDSRGTLYLDLGANYEIAKGITLNGHVGFTQLSSGSNYGPDYTDYKVGATYDFGNGFSLAGAIVGADKKGAYGDINKTRLIVTLTKSM